MCAGDRGLSGSSQCYLLPKSPKGYEKDGKISSRVLFKRNEKKSLIRAYKYFRQMNTGKKFVVDL